MKKIFHIGKEHTGNVGHHEKHKLSNYRNELGRIIPGQSHRSYPQKDCRRKLTQIKNGCTRPNIRNTQNSKYAR